MRRGGGPRGNMEKEGEAVFLEGRDLSLEGGAA